MARTAPSYLPAGGLVAPSGDGNGDDSSADVKVDSRPDVSVTAAATPYGSTHEVGDPGT
jgi:hypothetical protein